MRFGQLVSLVAVLLGLVSAPATAAPGGPATAGQPTVEKVLIFSLPRVTWADFAEADLPHLTELLSHSMVAKLSPRTAGPRTMAADGYATIGAGNRADGAATEIVGGYALDRDERIDGRFAYQAYQARVGRQSDGRVLHLGLAEVIRQNQQNRYGAEPGALGSALRAAGRRTAVIGNSDAHGVRDRAAALAVMDRDGSVDRGQVSAKLIKADPTSPFGYELNPLAVADAFEIAWRTSDLTLVEASDLERVDAFEELALPGAWQKLRRDALKDADDLLGELLTRVDLSTDLVLVVTPAVPRKGEELGIFAMAGPGVRSGVAVSGTTRRAGYLTLPDIAPTILERFGVPAPLSMTGTPIRLGEAGPVDRAMIDDYVRANQLSVFRDRVTGPVTVVFIVLLALAFLLAALTLALPGRLGSRWRRTARGLLLLVLAVPPATFLSGLIPYDRLGPVGYVAALLLGAAGLAIGAAWLGQPMRARLSGTAGVLPPLLIVTLTWLVMIVDVLFYGGRLQLDTVFGYSPIVAGRFAGYGNFAFSLVAICAVIMVTGAWAIATPAGQKDPGQKDPEAQQAGRSWWRAYGLAAIAAILAFTVVVDGYPAYGSDVGGVLAAVPSFTVVLLVLAGVQITWRRLLLVGLLTVATLAAFALVDVSRPPEARTHMGRLVTSDSTGLSMMIQRKLFANLNILTSSVWTWVVPIALAFLIVLSLRRFGPPQPGSPNGRSTAPATSALG
ncbi:MAG TPA: hypothetical protein VHJ83_12545, partial [Micromonosporaceae bacterium]|nr:hypothetical protein [Micromonosporaceae bacterium]